MKTARSICLGVVALSLAFAALWAAGESHKQNCLRASLTDCSVLPWDNGRAPFVTASPGAKRPAFVYCYKPDATRTWLTDCVARTRLTYEEGLTRESVLSP